MEHFESNYSNLGPRFRRCNLKENFTDEACQTKTDHNSSSEIKKHSLVLTCFDL